MPLGEPKCPHCKADLQLGGFHSCTGGQMAVEEWSEYQSHKITKLEAALAAKAQELEKALAENKTLGLAVKDALLQNGEARTIIAGLLKAWDDGYICEDNETCKCAVHHGRRFIAATHPQGIGKKACLCGATEAPCLCREFGIDYTEKRSCDHDPMHTERGPICEKCGQTLKG